MGIYGMAYKQHVCSFSIIRGCEEPGAVGCHLRLPPWEVFRGSEHIRAISFTMYISPYSRIPRSNFMQPFCLSASKIL